MALVDQLGGVEPTDPRAAMREAVERMCGEGFGLLQRCRELPAAEGEPRLSMCLALGPKRLPGWRLAVPVQGMGVAPEPEAARHAAVGEAVERYCSIAPIAQGALVRATPGELTGAIPPRRFPLLSDQQCRSLDSAHRHDPQRAIDWCLAFSLTHQRAVLVPAAFVHLTLAGRGTNDFVPELSSSGTACHVSPTQAVLSGLCEVMERDALALAWHCRLPLRRVDPSATAAGREVAERFAGCDADVEVLALPTDAPFPVVLAVAHSDASYPHAVVGVACRPTLGQAVARALCEAAQVRRSLRSRGPASVGEVRHFADHADFYASAEGAALLRSTLVLDVGPTPPPAGDAGGVSAAGALEAGVNALAALGLEVLVVDLTTPDVGSAGLRVVRVVVPGMLDVSADPRFARLGATRLRQLPVRLGFRRAPLDESKLNVLPVPLA